MDDARSASDGAPVAGWVLRGHRSWFDIGPMVEAYGQVYRYPVEPGPRADRMAAGQPCFLHLTDTSRVVGLWAVGEVVAPVLELEVGPDDPHGPTRLFAEVEMLLLAKPIPVDRLRADPQLGRSEIFSVPDGHQPLVLDRRAVKAIEAFEMELVPPDAEQAERLERLLAEEEAGPGGG